MKECNDSIIRVVTFLYKTIGNEKATVYFQRLALKCRFGTAVPCAKIPEHRDTKSCKAKRSGCNDSVYEVFLWRLGIVSWPTEIM